jgi:hypothetical protein
MSSDRIDAVSPTPQAGVEVLGAATFLPVRAADAAARRGTLRLVQKRRARAASDRTNSVGCGTLRSFPKEFNHPLALVWGQGSTSLAMQEAAGRDFMVTRLSPRFWPDWASEAGAQTQSSLSSAGL